MSKYAANSVTIIGGSGTLGKSLLHMIYNEWPKTDITVVSRDEHKQAKLKRLYPRAKFAIACIRDEAAILPLVAGRDVVFHVAAMKHVDLIEDNPIEAKKTNLDGTINIAHACMAGSVKHVVFSSTDKAVDPINAYGYTKSLAEKILLFYNRHQSRTKFSIYRWGNVLGSQGSVIPEFVKTLQETQKVQITHPDMTRFWLPIEWAVRFMLRTFPDAKRDQAMIPPNMKAANILEVAAAVADLIGIKSYETVINGIRPGEKLHEVMYSQHGEEQFASNTCDRYTREELKDLIRPLVMKQLMETAA